jgi:CRISPR/Cas system-associated protein Csm6
VRTPNKLLLALGTIALSAVVAPDEADAQYQEQCDWLAQQSPTDLEQFVRQNPDHACAEVAALMLVERTLPATVSRAASGGQGRY